MAKTAAPNYAALFADDAGSHKYIPTYMLNPILGLRDGSGVYGYAKFDDGSYLLFSSHTEPGKGLAWWDGNNSDPKVEWIKYASKEEVEKREAEWAARKKK
jgi:hypothetical protein